MKNRILTSALAISVVTLVAGAAFSGGHQAADSELVDFDQSTGHLWAVPQNQHNAALFQHTPQTFHLEGLGLSEPPDPCNELGHLWNFTVRYDRHYHTDSRAIYESLLTLMATNACIATITTTSGSPPPITSIAPGRK